jgi:DNA-binding response OmpR family regulator
VKAKTVKSVLVVDDNEQALSLVKEALETRSYEVTTCSRGAIALEVFESKKGDSIDLVIIDLVMPDMDGIELTTKLLAKRPATKILVMSGYADDVIGAFKGHAVEFLGKPFSIRDLFDRVANMVDK